MKASRHSPLLLLNLAVWLLPINYSGVSAFSIPDSYARSFNSLSNGSGLLTRRRSINVLSSKTNEDETTELLKKAQLLREQAEKLETTKREEQQIVEQQEAAVRMEEQQKRNDWKDRYSVVVPILKDMGEEVMERVDFPPRIKGGKSRVLSTEAPLPLGIVLGQDNDSGLITVDELAPEGNGATIGMIREGDILRAVTACQTTMETPTWQLLAGGIGQPKTKRFMFSADGRPLEDVLNAVGSNRMDVSGRDVVLVLERVDY